MVRVDCQHNPFIAELLPFPFSQKYVRCPSAFCSSLLLLIENWYREKLEGSQELPNSLHDH